MTGIGKRVFRGVGTLTWVTWAAMKLHDWRSTSIRPCNCSVQRRVSTAHCTGPLRVLASDGRNQRLIAPFSSTLISTSVGGAMAHVSAAAAVGTRTGRFRFTVGTTLFWVFYTPILSCRSFRLSLSSWCGLALLRDSETCRWRRAGWTMIQDYSRRESRP